MAEGEGCAKSRSPVSNVCGRSSNHRSNRSCDPIPPPTLVGMAHRRLRDFSCDRNNRTVFSSSVARAPRSSRWSYHVELQMPGDALLLGSKGTDFAPPRSKGRTNHIAQSLTSWNPWPSLFLNLDHLKHRWYHDICTIYIYIQHRIDCFHLIEYWWILYDTA